MKYLLIFILVAQVPRCNGQDFSRLLHESKIITGSKGYTDRNSRIFNAREIADIDTRIVFDKVQLNKNDGSLFVSGQVIVVLEDSTERMGFCCLFIFIAQTIGDSLVSIDKIGETNSNLENPSKPYGYFEVIFKPTTDKKLFFCSEIGAGLHEYSLSRISPI